MSLRLGSLVGFTFALLALTLFSGVVRAQPVGKVISNVEGTLIARDRNGNARSLERDADFSSNEVLVTGDGFASLFLADGTAITMRPNTRFAVANFAVKNVPSENLGASARLGLSAGGVRVVTGEIAALNPGGFSLVARDCTMQPHGTDFEVRICDGDCDDAGTRLNPIPAAVESPVVARIVFLRGRATAEQSAGRARTLALGGSLFEQETLRSARRSVVAVAFQDGQRATLQSESTMVIERYRSRQVDEQTTDAQLRLLKGGMRLLAGLKEKHLSVAMTVKTATGDMDVASEGVDVVCTGTCESDSAKSSWLDPGSRMPAVAQGLLDLLIPQAHARVAAEGLLVRPWGGGEVVLTGRGGLSARVESGRAMWLSGANAVPVELLEIPHSMDLSGLPRPDLPDSLDPSMLGQELFVGVRHVTPQAGVYVRVFSGDVTTLGKTGQRVDLGPTESGFCYLSAAGVQRLAQPPSLTATPPPFAVQPSVHSSPSADVFKHGLNPLLPAAVLGGAALCIGTDCAGSKDARPGTTQTRPPISP